MTARPHAGFLPGRREWVILRVAVGLVLLAGAAWVVLHHHDGPATPYRGAAAAAFLVKQPGGNDRIVRARCADAVCSVWLRPIPANAAVPERRAYQDLAVDDVFVSNLAAVATPSWRFILTEANGVMTATCTNAEAHRIGGLITPHLLPSTCPTTWRPTSP
jgi:hypothetical protein